VDLFLYTIPQSLCYADVSISQGSVAKLLRYSEIFNDHFVAKLQRNMPEKGL